MTEKMPSLTVDAVIEFTDGRVALVKRGNPPFKGMWALPGGFVEYEETVADACRREIMEECGVEIELGDIIGVYSDPKRDPRGHTISVIFRAKWVGGELKGGDDAAEAKLFGREELVGMKLAFDHALVLKDAGYLS